MSVSSPERAAPSPSASRPSPSRQFLAVVALACAAQVLFSWALVAQHRAYNSNGWDLAWFDQVVWNTAHGRFFETSFAPWNFLGEHVEPVLLLFALVYRVHAEVKVLLLTQAAVAAWAAVPLYLAARRVLASATAGLLVAAAYLGAAHLHRAMLFDFHPEVMGTACIFGAFALVAAGRPGWALAAIGAQFLLKEDAALVGAGFALVLWLYGYRAHAIGLLAAATVYFLLVAGVLMPAVRGGPGGPHARYGYLGPSLPEAVLGAVHHPHRILERLARPEQRGAAAELLASQAVLPLAGPAALGAVPLLAAHLLSEHPAQAELALHYGVLPFALLLVAAVLGAARLARAPRLAVAWRWTRLPPAARTTVLTGALLGAELVYTFAAGPFGRRFALSHYQRTAHSAAVDRVLAAVPRDGAVAAQSGLLPHLSQRRWIWEFPPVNDAPYVVVDRRAWRNVHGPPTPEYDYDAALAALPERGYCLLRAEDGVELYARHDRCPPR
jgi:hypothetical protein